MLEFKSLQGKKELKGFVKISLIPEEIKKVTIELDDHAFAYFNTLKNRWVVESGEYLIHVGASSRDIRLSFSVHVEGEECISPYDELKLKNNYSFNMQNIPDEEFKELLGYTPPPQNWDKTLPLGFNDTIGQGQYGKGLGKCLYRLTKFIRNYFLFIHNPIMANNIMYILDLPYRHLHRMSSGRIDRAMLDGILVMVNGHFFKGLKQYRIARRAKLIREKKVRHEL